MLKWFSNIQRLSNQLSWKKYADLANARSFSSKFINKHKTAYDTLDIKMDASKEDIKRAFAKLAKKYHPDRNPESSEIFTEIMSAYEILNNDITRKEYDRKISKGTHAEFFRNEKSQNRKQDYSESSYFYEKKARDEYGEEIFVDFKNFFSDKKKAAIKGDNIEKEIELSFLDSVHGALIDFQYMKSAKCATCSGSRCEPGTVPSKCWTCGGKGTISYREGPHIIHENCDKCKGGGMTIKYPCVMCEGKGCTDVTTVEKVRVRRGIMDNEEIVIAKKGHDSTFGPSGDQTIKITIKKDDILERRGLDIISEVNQNPYQAVLGYSAKVHTIHGEQELYLRPGLKPGDYQVLRNWGIQETGNKEENSNGNHLLYFNIKIPKDDELSDKKKELYKRLLKMEDFVLKDMNNLKNKCYNVYMDTESFDQDLDAEAKKKNDRSSDKTGGSKKAETKNNDRKNTQFMSKEDLEDDNVNKKSFVDNARDWL